MENQISVFISSLVCLFIAFFGLVRLQSVGYAYTVELGLDGWGGGVFVPALQIMMMLL